MRFVQFTCKSGGPQHLGVQLEQGGGIVALSKIDSSVPNNLKEFLEGGDDLLNKAKRIVSEAENVTPEAEVKFLAPVTGMDKLACIGLNYADHAKETGEALPERPMVFSKFPSIIIGPTDNIELPTISDEVDWEVELVIVIGKKGKHINKQNAEDYIFGYTVAQDVSARDWQKRLNGGQFLIGKSMDTFCPLGPAVITKDAISDVNNLRVKTWVNGKIKQDSNTRELIFKPPDIVAHLSQFVTLLPGDIILTGTPGGVGVSRNPPEYLKKGDIVETEIEGLGRLQNKCV
ncbi:fumarylacetoacetate hydrolase domain-containing protein 2A [Belonocnema kinseyi]|uniref:fumarylacetoacetate hydrolase domain-containing protein 2A n=1 Tax=Belonocnema kinseyi TaxID=2817044 RepID=UPI00143CDC7C|nr:fumarylacetoacetate hydrolase domain-containing protein 2A [Belonocnema kinseyi]